MSNPNNHYFEEQLNQSLKYGFIHNVKYQNNLYAPKVLVNNPEKGEFVLTELQNELKKSHFFCMNVAFITTAGLGMLKSQLYDFAIRGGTGKILVSSYLGFNEPETLFELLKLRNIEVRLTKEETKMHAKMYIFHHAQEQAVIVGSSNLTHSALKVNYEWNVKLTSTDNGDFIKRTQEDFDDIWNQSIVLNEETIQDYAKQRKNVDYTRLVQEQRDEAEVYNIVVPNKMKEKAVAAIEELRSKGAERSLVISATGTGKTYLAAFDAKHYRPKKMLFVVHREQILRDALSSFQEVIGFKDEEATIYSSGDDLTDKKYVFTTIQSLSRRENISKLHPQEFDYMIIDEVHHAAASSYQTIMNHFTPEFILGLTATPERTDGQNIFELFHYNVAYEIRLQEALAENMLSPFLYYGVIEMRKEDGELIDEKDEFNWLVTTKRVDHIIEKVDYYGIHAETTRGLIFCSRNDEAKELSTELNRRGYRTRALSGSHNQAERESVIHQLEIGELDYILTVDIFNEGIDIPSLNQVIMLRNTESSIVFIQQLGRGLRKHPQKEFVTIIDFIGNYRNNYLIPIALYGDQSFNKDNYRRKMGQSYQLNGLTTINFEEVAQQQIFNSITETKLSSIATLKKVYLDLKNHLGEPPLLYDYYRNRALDPMVFFEDSRFKHYGDVIYRFEAEQDKYIHFSEEETGILRMLSFELLNGKRPHELILLRMLITQEDFVTKEAYLEELNKVGAQYSKRLIRSVERILTLDFFIKNSQQKYGAPLILKEQSYYKLSQPFKTGLKNPVFKKLIVDLIKTGIAHSKRYPGGYTLKGLEVGEKYTRKDVVRLLLWDNDESSTVYGYRVKYQTCPIFITYHKADDISESTKYGDKFINEHLLHWYTRSNLTTKSKEVVDLINSKENNIGIHIFVKKEDNEGRDFYYLGEANYLENSAQNHKMSDQTPVVTMDLSLNTPMSYQLFQYLVREE